MTDRSMPLRRPAPSVRSRLLLLVLACVVPASLAAWAAITRAYQEETAALTWYALAEARSTMQRVDAELAAAVSSLQALATSPALAARDFAAFDTQARAALPYLAGDNFVLSEAGGQQIMNTLVPSGRPLPRHGSPELLHQVVQGRRPVVSDLFVGGVTQRPLIAVEVPVIADGRVTPGLAMGFSPDRLARQLTRRPSADWLVGVFDSRGTIVARSHGAERLVGTSRVRRRCWLRSASTTKASSKQTPSTACPC
jgi:hypothetical protein